MEEVIYLPKDSADDVVVAVQPNFFHNIMEQAQVADWQIIQEPNNTLKIMIVEPEKGFNESNFVKTFQTELARR